MRPIKRTHSPTVLETPCRTYRGSVDRDGYGRRNSRGVHRWVMEQVLGRRLASTEVVMHRCDNPPCFRYDHLVLGTHQQNIADRDAKGRRVQPPASATTHHGMAHGRAKLTDEQVYEIRRLAAASVPFEAIGRQFGVSGQTAWRIHHRKGWAHLA